MQYNNNVMMMGKITVRKKILLIGAIAVVIALGLWYGYTVIFAPRFQNDNDLVSRVASHIVLPQDEEPSIATVSDKSQLAGQPFFSEAEVGDKVLIYGNNRKAILYRPRLDKIINITSVKLAQSKATDTSPLSDGNMKAELTVGIYNGTSITGLASTTGKLLTERYPQIKIVSKANAVNTYSENIVVDMTGTKSKEAELLSKMIDGSVGPLPSEEKEPDADIVIFLGKQIKEEK